MARALKGLKADAIGVARAGLTAADNATLTEANIPPGQAIDCRGFDTIWIGVEPTGGAGPTVTIEVLFYDPDAVDSGTAAASRWKRPLQGAPNGITAVGAPAARTTGALDGTSFVELRVDGRKQVFLRVTAVAGGPTAFDILVAPGARRYTDNFCE